MTIQWRKTDLAALYDAAMTHGHTRAGFGSAREAELCRFALYRFVKRGALAPVIIAVNDNEITVAKPQHATLTFNGDADV